MPDQLTIVLHLSVEDKAPEIDLEETQPAEQISDENIDQVKLNRIETRVIRLSNQIK